MGIAQRRRALLAAALVFSIAIVIAACGSGSSGAAAPSATPASAAAQGNPSGSTTTSTAASANPGGSSTQTISVGGVERTFHVYRPAKLPAAAPLVVMLHGGFGSGTNAEKSYGWDAQADSAGFVVVYPDGLNKAWNTGGGCCGQSGRNGVDDVGFISQMVATIEKEIPVDTDRIYATGISNGGIMSYTLACQTTIFAAIGPDSATQLGGCPSPAPISVIHIHGTADKTIPYNGGEGEGTAHINGPAVPALNATWRATDSCSAPNITTAGAVTTSIASCPGGRAVELITIAGAGHQWPGAKANKVAEKLLGTDPPSTALNATKVIWQFFSQHRK